MWHVSEDVAVNLLQIGLLPGLGVMVGVVSGSGWEWDQGWDWVRVMVMLMVKVRGGARVVMVLSLPPGPLW